MSNAEKLRILLNDIAALKAQQPKQTDSSAPAPMTMHSRTIGEEAFPRGRYSAEVASDVTGATPAPQYPAAGVSWPEFLNGPEFLGYEINALEEPAGEPHEIEQAQQILEQRASSVPASAAAAPDQVPPFLDQVERSSAPLSRIRRRI